MPQTRLHLRCHGALARKAYKLLETAFEEDGLALALMEIDEAADLQEISVYVTDNPEGVEARMRVVLGPLPDLPEIERELLPEIDWVTESLKGLNAVRAGRFFVHGAHERGLERAGEISIEIEAGLAFGTGHHGTTAGCLEMIERVLRAQRPLNALDLGAGSAVLAIAIAKRAHIPVLATDIDPIATRVASGNIRLNGVERLVKTVTATGFGHPAIAARKPFDLIVANILARPLMRLAPAMAQHVAPGGTIILSGILDWQRRAVIAAYVGQGFRHVSTLYREGWVTIRMAR